MSTLIILLAVVSAYLYSNQNPNPVLKPKPVHNATWLLSQDFDDTHTTPDKMILIGKPSRRDWQNLFPCNKPILLYRDQDDNFWVEEEVAEEYLSYKSKQDIRER